MDQEILRLFLGATALEGEVRNKGALFPMDDGTDFAKGVRFVPGEVTIARRRGERVVLVQDCRNPCCWFWRMPDGSRIYHWDPSAYERMAETNGSKMNDPGPCLECQNTHVFGGTVKE